MFSLISIRSEAHSLNFVMIGTSKEESSGAAGKIRTAKERKFPPKNYKPSAKNQNTLAQTINSICTSCIEEPEEIPPDISHTPSLKHVSTIFQIHHPALKYRLRLLGQSSFAMMNHVLLLLTRTSTS